MQLVTIADSSGGRPGLVVGTRIFDLRVGHPSQHLSRWRPDSVVGILDAGEEGIELLGELSSELQQNGDDPALKSAWLDLTTTALGPPIRRPGLLVSVHFDTEGSWVPLIKSPNALTGPNASVPASSHRQEPLAVRGQLAMVVGRRCSAVSAADGESYIGGLTLALDINHHAVQLPGSQSGDVWLRHLGGQQAGFYPLGPALRVGARLDDGGEELKLSVNGAVGETWSPKDLPLSCGEVLATISMYFPLKPGDVISVSPPGVSPLTTGAGDGVTLQHAALGSLAVTIADA